MNIRQGIAVLMALLFGFAIGWFCKPREQQAGVAKNNSVAPVNAAQPKRAELQQQNPMPAEPSPAASEPPEPDRVLKSTDTIKIPLGLIDSTMATLLSDGNLEGLGVALMTYNLPPERGKILLTGV